MRLWLPLTLLIVATPAEASVLYFSGFELGPPGIPFNTDIRALGTSSTVQTSTVHSGAYALEQLAVPTDLKDNLNTATIACRFYFDPSVNTSTNGVMTFEDSGFIVGFRTSFNGTNMQITGQGGFSTTTGTAVVTTSQWNRIDVVYDTAANGVGKVYVNGVLDINTTHTGLNNNVFRIAVSGDSTKPYFFDDVFCQDTLSQPKDGRVIARQGIAGSPTDNAWTKSGCASIDVCWSNTPQDNTQSANSGLTTAAIAQTMVVHAFSTTQSGHGTDTVAANSTINGVKIALIGHTSNTAAGNGNQASFRVYVNGAGPTDTAFLYTSIADVGYETFFTDTVPNLDLYQMGTIKSATATARTHTVEDMWMQVDFLTPSGSARHRVTQ